MKPNSLQVHVWTPPRKDTPKVNAKTTQHVRKCFVIWSPEPLEISITKHTHLGTPGTAEAHYGAPGKALGYPWHKSVQQSTENASQKKLIPEKRPCHLKTFQEQPTLAEVFHCGSDAVRSRPQ